VQRDDEWLVTACEPNSKGRGQAKQIAATRIGGKKQAKMDEPVDSSKVAIYRPIARVKALHGSQPGRDRSAAGLAPAVILFIALPEPEDKSDLEMKALPLVLLPRRCPQCCQDTITPAAETGS
jgi:hypothetical protein